MIVGIDLGTSTSEIAVLKNGKPMILREIRGALHGILPSVVGMSSKAQLVVGDQAAAQALVRPDFTVQEVKRLMGSGRDVRLGAQEFSPQEISAMILGHLKQEAENWLGAPVTEAIITVPAYFTAVQRHATRDAGELAGLVVRRLINEPTAAALAYGIERPGVEEKIAVYDLGGGTLDVTVLELSEGILDVIASTGNSNLGGKEFDERLMRHLAEECRRANGVDLLGNPRTRQRLKASAKKAKEDLSALESVTVVLDNVAASPTGGPIDFEYELTRTTFENLIADLITSTAMQLDEALTSKNLRAEDIDKILLIGGSTRIPAVRQFVSQYFGGRPLSSEVSPEDAVALGAAVLGGIEEGKLTTETVVITDVSAWTLGVAVVEAGGDDTYHHVVDPLIPKQSTIPRTSKKIYSTIVDWQDRVRVRVFEGDEPTPEGNQLVGELLLDQLEPEPAGAAIEVEFSYDLSGELAVTARQAASGREARCRLMPGRTHLTTAQKAAAREKLNLLWAANRPIAQGPTAKASPREDSLPAWKQSKLFARVAPLVSQTEKRVAILPPRERAKITALLEQLRDALSKNDEVAVNRLEGTLVDALFEAE